MNRTSGVVAAAALLSGAAVWLWRRGAFAGNDQSGQARPLSRWEGEGGAPAAPVSSAPAGRGKHSDAEPSNRDTVGSTPDAWVYPRA
jgi:hypothetical protein